MAVLSRRERGRILTQTGFDRIWQALCFRFPGDRPTYAAIARCTEPGNHNGHTAEYLSPETISRILRPWLDQQRDQLRGVDVRSLEQLFRAFGLTLQPDDHQSAQAVADETAIDPNFVGREEAIADLDGLLSRGFKIIVIQARAGIGKTTLARHYLQQRFDAVLEFPIAKATKDIAPVEALLEEKLRQLGEEPGREFFVSLDRLKRKLQGDSQSDPSRNRLGILIDNLEPALDPNGRFIEPHRRYVELLNVLAEPSVQSTTLITSRERLHEYMVSVQHYPLRGLTLPAWEKVFQNRGLRCVDTPAMQALHRAHGGNAKSMDLISSNIAEDFAGDVEAYWRVNQTNLLSHCELEDQVNQQFNRLQELSPDAYNLLCRMGCYRYQDVPTVPIEGLFCLLWDVPESRHRRVVRALKDRSLVECEQERYWLHPVIRAQALDRLVSTPDYDTAHRHAAEFWTERVAAITTQDEVQTALEAYYHHIDRGDHEAAADVIIQKRPNRWGTNESLGRSLYKRGLLSQAEEVILAVVDRLPDSYRRARLYGILGAVYYYSSDNIHEAVRSCQKARAIAQSVLQTPQDDDTAFKLRLVEINALLTIGICQIALGEYEAGMAAHRQVEQLCQPLTDARYRRSVLFYIAYLHLRLGNRKAARKIADDLYAAIEQLGDHQLPSWVTEYRLFFLGLTYRELGEIQRSRLLYRRVLDFGERSAYGQATSKALYGDAALDTEEGRYDQAVAKHQASIQYLRDVGAKYDLAEAYYQQGLTYRAMGDILRSEESFQAAIALFQKTDAPKQVAKVQRAMDGS
ncbi:hypothetical protein [Thermoleptolyngbya sp. C42_A2020_037]|uniref:hypothetical protein n=1 Tax=Thermoleptolyngbya sp. C42_A2020_037 TaxID=2747799 RepID=UPI0019EAFB31|nr:hypothetical protein [Thermoleptolyngbya sp. C42_A2020_037]MBF2083322.1 hypothetical protein [Thermoleptolyngbya sp. C42_A2020_037]